MNVQHIYRINLAWILCSFFLSKKELFIVKKKWVVNPFSYSLFSAFHLCFKIILTVRKDYCTFSLVKCEPISMSLISLSVGHSPLPLPPPTTHQPPRWSALLPRFLPLRLFFLLPYSRLFLFQDNPLIPNFSPLCPILLPVLLLVHSPLDELFNPLTHKYKSMRIHSSVISLVCFYFILF